MITASAESRFDLDTEKNCYIVNLTPGDTLAVRARPGRTVRVYDAVVSVICSFLSNGSYAEIKVPLGGMASVEKQPGG